VTAPVIAGAASTRRPGAAPIRDYAAIGDGHAVALVARGGSIDWLCLPNLDSPSVFGALLDDEGGGRFVVQPEEPAEVERRYLPDTNVLETAFRTASGAVRLTDALTLGASGPLPWREIVRQIEGLGGRVRVWWRFEPRFDHGRLPPTMTYRDGLIVARGGREALVLRTWDAGEPVVTGDAVQGSVELEEGDRALLVVAAVDDTPLPRPDRPSVERHLHCTVRAWRAIAGSAPYRGPWPEPVRRSALALQLLTDRRTGAIAAAATTSLPERVGGDRNYDYRFCWPRDSSLVIDALLRLGYRESAHESLAWLLRALSRTHPRIQPIYRLDGTVLSDEEDLDLPGYRESQPVRRGNAAAGQIQLDAYGALLDAAWLYVQRGNRLDDANATKLGETVDLLAEIWSNPDAGIWELDDRRLYTQSRMAAWVAFDRIIRLAEAGHVPSRHVDRWRAEHRRVERFVEERCWSDERRSYVRWAGSDQLDAACLRMPRMAYRDPGGERFGATIDTVRRELGRGPLLYRFTGAEDIEAAFLPCSFWLVEALALGGRIDEAGELMEDLLGLANDVGLYSEEIDPDTGEFLGNFPQGLSHLALMTAAATIAEEVDR
jgi:GH15 family glucan-1,4-alpha-glucosidase